MPAPPLTAPLVEPADIARVERLELTSQRVVDGLLSGRHRSRLKGGSAEFAEHRAYSPGDEIRLIDWKVYAKSDRHYIREFIEQTSLQVVVGLDASGSMSFSGAGASKFQYARAAVACLARLALRQSDAAGLAVIQSGLSRFVPARSNPKHFQAILQELEATRPDGEARLSDALTEIVRRIRRRGLILLFSDAFDDLSHLGRSLRYLRSRGHEAALFHTLAPEELTFDFSRWSRFECLEGVHGRCDLEPDLTRKDYLDRLRAFLARLKRICGETRCDYVPMPTQRPVGDALTHYLKMRAARIKTR